MRAIVRNVLLACLISTFAFFGAIGRKHVDPKVKAKDTAQQIAAQEAEARKETFTCLAVAGLAWVLCFWRCGVINRRLNEERVFRQRFDQYARQNVYGTRQYK